MTSFLNSILLISITIQQLVLSQIDFDSFDFRTYIDDESTYLIAWTIDPTQTNITIGISAPTTGWAGFGVSPNGKMPLSDIAFFWVDDTLGTVFLQDRYTESVRAQPKLDTNQNLILLQGEQVNGKTNIVFQRSVFPCDTDTTGEDRDFIIGTSRIIYAFDDNNEDPVIVNYDSIDPVMSEITFGWHGYNNMGQQSINILNGISFNVDLEGDTQTADITVGPDYNVPVAGTTYYETYHQLPISGSDVYHVTRIDPVVTTGNEKTVHHLVMYYCGGNPTVNPNITCNTAAFAWAVGGASFIFPQNVGLEMSVNYLNWIKLQIHYDNPSNDPNIWDSSGIKIYYTTTLRQYDAGLIEIGLPLGTFQFIPPGISWTKNSAFCTSECTNATDAIESTGVYAFSSFLHAHTLGRALELKHIRDGVELPPIDANWAYDFDYQQNTPLIDHILILPGDEFQLDCYYNSSNKSGITYGGTSTADEMCQAYIYVYPKPKLGLCLTQFTDIQIGTWGSEAITAGYLTGNDQTNYVYHSDNTNAYYSSLLQTNFANAIEFYNFLWQSDVAVLASRDQLCQDIYGNQLTSGYTYDKPYGYTLYTDDTPCNQIDDPIGQIGDYPVQQPTNPPTANPVQLENGKMLCGSAEGDGQATSISVSVCVDVDNDKVYINITGPGDVWFGVGWDATNMDHTYAIVISGDSEGLGMNQYGEYILESASMGTAAPFDGDQGIQGDGVTFENNKLTVELIRDRLSTESGVYSFPNSETSINVIFGKGEQTAYGGGMGGHSNGGVELQFGFIDSVGDTTAQPDTTKNFESTEGNGDGNDCNMISFGLMSFAITIIAMFIQD